MNDIVEEDEDRSLTMVDEALVAGNIANTNGLLVILAKLVAKGIFDAEDLHAFSDSYSTWIGPSIPAKGPLPSWRIWLAFPCTGIVA